MLVILLISMTHEFWSIRVGQSLICAEERSQSDIIIAGHFDPNPILFERGAELHRAGFASRAGPTDPISSGTDQPESWYRPLIDQSKKHEPRRYGQENQS